jgi:hypothetical protein
MVRPRVVAYAFRENECQSVSMSSGLDLWTISQFCRTSQLRPFSFVNKAVYTVCYNLPALLTTEATPFHPYVSSDGSVTSYHSRGHKARALI